MVENGKSGTSPLRIREFPKAFHEYRKDEMTVSATLRPIQKEKKSSELEDPSVTPEEKAEFKRQHKVVENGVKAFWQVGQALAVIKARNLWKAGGHKSWDAYCRSVAGMSRGHAHRLMGAAGFLEMFKTSPRGDVLPMMEAQVRPLLRLPDPEQQVTVWVTAVERAGADRQTRNASLTLRQHCRIIVATSSKREITGYHRDAQSSNDIRKMRWWRGALEWVGKAGLIGSTSNQSTASGTSPHRLPTPEDA